MESALNAIAGFLIQQSWQILVVFTLALAGSWALRKASAHWRYLLWLVVIAKCLTPPLFDLTLAVLPRSSEAISGRRASAAPSCATFQYSTLRRTYLARQHLPKLNKSPRPALRPSCMRRIPISRTVSACACRWLWAG